MELEIFISTDVNEVKGVLEGKVPSNKEFVRDYSFLGEGIIHFDHLDLTARNISIEDGKRIQRDYGIHFNPSSKIYISKDIPRFQLKEITKRLVWKGEQFIAICCNGTFQELFPNPYR